MFKTRRAWIGVISALTFYAAIGPVALARKATVTTNDGRQFIGEVDAENEKGIKLFISGISTLISKEDIRDVRYELTVSEEFQQRRKLIKDDDLDARYKLAYWLYDKKNYALAQKELNDLQSQFPKDGRVISLQELVANRIKLHKTSPVPKPMPKRKPGMIKPGTTGGQGNGKTRPSTTNGRSRKDKYTRLTEEQINLIKVYEIDFTRNREPRIVIPRDVIIEFLEEYADKDKALRGRKAQQSFRASSGVKQLRKMFQLRAREFYGRAEVRQDPAAMELFKKSVHRTYVLNYCGTTRCHGGPDAGEFKLIPFRQTSDETVYTNFFLINQWQRGEGYMIDRDKIEHSYLIQYGLPRKNAKYPHPANIKGWKPNLIGRSNTTRRNLQDWVGRLYRPAPNYHVSFKLELKKEGVNPPKSDSPPKRPPVKVTAPEKTPSQ